jgi:hypothetical protein
MVAVAAEFFPHGHAAAAAFGNGRAIGVFLLN